MKHIKKELLELHHINNCERCKFYNLLIPTADITVCNGARGHEQSKINCDYFGLFKEKLKPNTEQKDLSFF